MTWSAAIWDRLRAGFEEINAAYPTAWNAHHFAFYACMAGDFATVRHLLTTNRRPPVREAWDSPIIYEQCRQKAALRICRHSQLKD